VLASAPEGRVPKKAPSANSAAPAKAISILRVCIAFGARVSNVEFEVSNMRARMHHFPLMKRKRAGV
jgi:hypothetical protein